MALIDMMSEIAIQERVKELSKNIVQSKECLLALGFKVINYDAVMMSATILTLKVELLHIPTNRKIWVSV